MPAEKFDLHQRYEPLAQIVRQIVSPGEGRILDLEAPEGDGLTTRLGEGYDVSRGRRREGGEFSLDEETASFDVVVASDVLGSVEPASRPKALAEMNRVARRAILLSFPSKDSQTDSIEALTSHLFGWASGEGQSLFPCGDAETLPSTREI